MNKQIFHNALGELINDALLKRMPPDEIITSLEMHKLGVFKAMHDRQQKMSNIILKPNRTPNHE